MSSSRDFLPHPFLLAEIVLNVKGLFFPVFSRLDLVQE